MATLRKFTLEFNEKKEQWDLKKDVSNQLVKSFQTKADATKRGVLEKAIGKPGGSVKIQKKNGRYDEERTYPSSADPHKSKG